MPLLGNVVASAVDGPGDFVAGEAKIGEKSNL